MLAIPKLLSNRGEGGGVCEKGDFLLGKLKGKRNIGRKRSRERDQINWKGKIYQKILWMVKQRNYGQLKRTSFWWAEYIIFLSRRGGGEGKVN
jgi:hypothetical protein